MLGLRWAYLLSFAIICHKAAEKYAALYHLPLTKKFCKASPNLTALASFERRLRGHFMKRHDFRNAPRKWHRIQNVTFPSQVVTKRV